MRASAIEAAAELFGTAGYRGVTFKDVAAKLGMTAAGLSYYFPDKDALLAAVLQERDRPALAPDTGLPAARSRADLIEATTTYLTENIERRGLPELHCVITAEATSPEHPAHEHIRDRYRSGREVLTETLERLARRGELRTSIAPRVLATLLLSVLDGVELQWLLDPEEVDMREAATAFLSELLAPQEAS
ncbi:TetR family transcriptional regulator [Streptomyces sp. SID8361]|nr:TetR family transcriptional regulator [Streptomyces sp. SID8361]